MRRQGQNEARHRRKKKIETKEKAVLNQFFPRNCVALMCVLTGVLALSESKRNVKYVLRM